MSRPPPPTDIAAEGDVNLSPLRRAWESRHIGPAARALLDADSEYFLHQSLSTPCLNALRACGKATDQEPVSVLPGKTVS